MSKFLEKRIILLAIVVISVLFMTGCIDKQTPAEKMYEKLENVVVLEKTFEEQQQPLVELEEKEKEIYEKIVNLGMKEFDQIVLLSDEAIGILDQRKEKIEKEQESLDSAKVEFETVKELIEEIEETDLKDKATNLYTVMEQRYKSHNDLYIEYLNGIDQDKFLYELFKKEDLTMDQLEEQINKINETYAKVIDANKKFNELTDNYNEAKLSFYKEAGLNIELNKE